MRWCGVRPSSRLVASIVATGAVLALPAYARAEASVYGPKVDDRLAAHVREVTTPFAAEQEHRRAHHLAQQAAASDAFRAAHEARRTGFDAKQAELAAAFALDQARRYARFRTEQAKRAKTFGATQKRLAKTAKTPAARKALTRRSAKFLRSQIARAKAFVAGAEARAAAFDKEQAGRASAFAAAQKDAENAFAAESERADAAFAAEQEQRAASFDARTTVRGIVYGEFAENLPDSTPDIRRDLDDAVSMRLSLAELKTLVARDDVNYVAGDVAVRSTSTAPELVQFPSLATLYPLVNGAGAAWSRGLTGAGVGIAVIDSGTTPLPDFGNRLVQVKLPAQQDIQDTVGHGTFVAGVAGGRSADGRYVGIAPGATLYSVNVSRPDGVYTSDVIAGLKWVLDNRKHHNIRVVVMSLAENAASSYMTNPLDGAAEQLWKAGIVVVVSAGNKGAGQATFAPGNDPFVISVGATDVGGTLATADDTVTPWSTSGKTLDGHSKPDVVAPGRHIVGPLPLDSELAVVAPPANHVAPGYVRMNGTSLSAPQVAGAAAILLQQHPSWSPDEVKWVLTTQTHPVAGVTAGALDIAAATAFAGSPGKANGGLAWSLFVDPSKALISNGRSSYNSSAVDVKKAKELEKDAAKFEKAAAWDKAAAAWDAAGAIWAEKVGSFDRAALAYERAAAAWDRYGDFAKAAAAWDRAAAAWDRAAAWDKSAAAWDKSAAAWDRAAAWDKSAAAWDKSAAAWDRAAAWDKSAAAWDKGAAAWDRAAAWDKASFSRAQSAAAWDRAAAWDASKAAAWDASKAAAWDGASSSWD